MRTLPSRRNPRNKAATNRRTPRRLTSPKETKSSRHWSAESPNDIFHSLGRQDEGHFWSVSRYIHLNPVRGKRPLVSHPRNWLWSSYSGYGDKRKRLPWVSYDLVLAAWQGGSGGLNPAAAYRRYVEQGLQRPPKNPLAGAAHGWLLGGEDFVDRIRGEMKDSQFVGGVPRARTLGAVDVESVFEAVTDYFDVDRAILSLHVDGHIARAVAAWLATV